MHRSRFKICLLALPVLIQGMMAQVPKGPLEIRQDLTTYNVSSKQGLPISSVANTPPGSNGKVPPLGSQLPPLPSGNPTPRQVQSVLSFGGGVRPVAMKAPNLNPFVLNLKTLPSSAFSLYPAGSTTASLGYVQQAFDDNTSTSYLNYYKAGSGVTIDAGSAYLATSLSFSTSTDSSDRDPAGYEVLGSTDGTTFTSIQKGTLTPPAGRSAAYDSITLTGSTS